MLRFLTLLSLFVGSLLAAELQHTGHSEDDLIQWRIPTSDFDVKPADRKPKPPIMISTSHIQGGLGPLGMTTGELKLFSGHALNLLKSKCPNVNYHTIFKLHKYIGKRITKDDPVQGNNEKLRTLLDKMMECSSKVVQPSKIIIESDEAKSEDKVEIPAGSAPAAVVSTLVVKIKNDVPQSTHKPVAPALPVGAQPVADKKKWSEMTHEEKTRELAAMLNHFEPQKKTSTQKPADVTEVTPTTTTTATTTKPKRHPIVGWLSSVMQTVSEFFRSIFGFGTVRSRRQAQSEAPENSPYVLAVWSGPSSGEDKSVGGRQAFLTLMDELCRLYCDTCPGDNQSTDFKRGAKELLQYLFAEDSTGLDLAAQHYLNHEFLQSVQECGRT